VKINSSFFHSSLFHAPTSSKKGTQPIFVSKIPEEVPVFIYLSIYLSIRAAFDGEGIYMADIIVNGISKSFGEKTVLSGVSLRFEEGRRTALMGASGCGKTTLLRIIAGLECADSGEIIGIEPGEFGMVFQEARLFPTATAEENVACVRQSRKDGFAASALRALGFDATDMKKRPHELSGGMQRRVAIARAIAYCDRLFSEGRRPILLLDEAIKELDGETRDLARKYVSEFCDRTDCTVISVTHDEEEAASFCHTVIRL